MNQYLIDMIKKGRKEKGYTQSEVASKLGIKGNTLSGYETGATEPDIDTYLELCRIYDLDYADVLETAYNLKKYEEFHISNSEQKHIKKYRALEPQGKEMVDTVLDKEYEFMQHRRAKAVETEQAREFIMLEPPKVIPSFQSIACAGAGIGQYVFDDLVPDLIEVDTDCKADFVIDVSGDSMQPTYFDGDGLLVKKQNSVPIGEVGIFMIDGEAYVKEYGGDKLISHNKKYDDIILKEHQDIRCIGLVLGNLD